MAQFDVHRNPGENVSTIPWVVVVQSSQFENYRRKVVVPLVRASAFGVSPFATFNPAFRINGTRVVLHPLDIVSVPADRLGPPVATLSDESQAILGALDELFSRAWR